MSMQTRKRIHSLWSVRNLCLSPLHSVCAPTRWMPANNRCTRVSTSAAREMRYWRLRTTARWWPSTKMQIPPEGSPSPSNTQGATGARCRTPICTCLLSMSRWAIPSKLGRKSVFQGIPGHGLPASTCISG